MSVIQTLGEFRPWTFYLHAFKETLLLFWKWRIEMNSGNHVWWCGHDHSMTSIFCSVATNDLGLRFRLIDAVHCVIKLIDKRVLFKGL